MTIKEIARKITDPELLALDSWFESEDDTGSFATMLSVIYQRLGTSGVLTTLSGYGIADAWTKTECEDRYMPITYTPSWSEISSKPTTLGGYGITDAMNTGHVANSITATSINHWDTAYGWGNHASAGYLTSQESHEDVVVDGDFTSNGLLRRTAEGVYGIVTDNSSNWNTAYGWGNHATAGYLTAIPATVVETDQTNTFGAFDQLFPIANFKLVSGSYNILFASSSLSANRTITFQNASGTIAYTNASSFTSLASIYSGTGTATVQIGYGATTSGNTKTINIGGAGLSGSTTNINIGSSVSGAGGTITLNHATTIAGTINSYNLTIKAASQGGDRTIELNRSNAAYGTTDYRDWQIRCNGYSSLGFYTKISDVETTLGYFNYSGDFYPGRDIIVSRKLKTASSTTTCAGLQIQGGVAPTTPETGEIWADVDNLYYCRNGVAKNFLFDGDALPFSGGTLTGKLTAFTSIAGSAGLTIPHGTAPTSPVNGDLWSTTTGWFGRTNGTTRQFATLDGTETLTNKTVNATNNTITDSSTAAGDLLVSNGTKFVRLAKGSALQILRVKSDDSTLEYATPSGTRLASFYADATTSGTDKTALYSYTMPANTLANNGESLECYYMAIPSTGDLSLEVSVFGNGFNQTISYRTFITVKIIRVSNTVARVTCGFMFPTTNGTQSYVELTGLDFTATQNIILYGTASSGSITAKMGYINKL